MQSARSWALTKLTYKFPKAYRRLYLEYKRDGTGTRECARAQSAAKASLAQRYWTDYKVLYELAVTENFPRSQHRQGGT